MSLARDLQARGIAKQWTEPKGPLSLWERLDQGPITLYCGFDPTADSLHVGSLLPLVTLKRFQQAGHRVLPIVGGATGRIGDPSFKSQERALLSAEQIERNVAGVGQIIERFLGVAPLNNAEWTREVSYLDFLRDVGKHFTINAMIAKESVRARLEDREQGISYTEFSYMLLQAFDYWHLYRNHECRLQVGGSDQWGNITAGIELIRRKQAADAGANAATRGHADEAYGLTHPLVTRSDGAKFGKTEAGTLWLDRERTPPYELYQFFLQAADDDALRYLQLFSFRSTAELDALAAAQRAHPERREVQQALASDVVTLVHGAAEAAAAGGATQALFGSNLDATQLASLTAEAFEQAMASVPRTGLERARVQAGIGIAELLVLTGLSPSRGQARKDIAGGGISLNQQRVVSETLVVGGEHVVAGRYVLLRKGKKTYHLLALD